MSLDQLTHGELTRVAAGCETVEWAERAEAILQVLECWLDV